MTTPTPYQQLVELTDHWARCIVARKRAAGRLPILEDADRPVITDLQMEWLAAWAQHRRELYSSTVQFVVEKSCLKSPRA